MNREAFLVYVDRVLGPTLKPGDIVVMDNLPAHKGEQVRALIQARDAKLMYLPPYSPDLNPIELAFAKIKGLLRKAAEQPSPLSGTGSAPSSTTSHRRNAQTTSTTMDTPQLKRRML
jgi:transposase